MKNTSIKVTQSFLRKFVRLVNDGPINAYSDEGAKRKEKFMEGCEAIAYKLADLMGLPKGSYEVRWNAAGIACSGDVHLHGERIYVALEQGALSRDMGFYYRNCNGKKDYCGGRNCWVKWERLLNLPALATEMERECEKLPAAV